MLHAQPWGPGAPSRPRLASSLRTLAAQVDEAWPGRDRQHDGWIGDAAHAARTSDHNPDGRGIVHAVDLTAHGTRLWQIVVAAVMHPSTNYVIHQGLIFSRSHGFAARHYDGPNPHAGHVHVSILHTPLAERSLRRWQVGAP